MPFVFNYDEEVDCQGAAAAGGRDSSSHVPVPSAKDKDSEAPTAAALPLAGQVTVIAAGSDAELALISRPSPESESEV